MALGQLASVLVAALGIALLQGNEAARSTKKSEVTSLTARSELNAAREAFEAKVRAMSVEQSIRLLHHRLERKAPGLLRLVQEHLGHRRAGGARRARHHRHLRKNEKAMELSGGGNASDGYESVKSAVPRLNEMMVETIEKADLEEIECGAHKRKQWAELEEIREDRGLFERLNTASQTGIIGSTGETSELALRIADAKEELSKQQTQCTEEAEDLQGQLQVVISDQGVMDKILNMTECSEDAVRKADELLLMQCIDARTGRHFTQVKASSALRQELGRLKHAKSLEVVKSAGLAPDEERGTSFLQQVDHTLRSGQPDEPALGPDPNHPVACSISNSSKCPELRERFTNIAGRIGDAKEELETMLENSRVKCNGIEKDLRDEMALTEKLLKHWNAKLAQFTMEKGSTQEQLRMKAQEEETATTAYNQLLEHCKDTQENLQSEQCALHKIRGELMKMSTINTTLLDCAVSSWVTGECTAKCGGGTSKLTRSVEDPPGPGTEAWKMGHACPVLTAEMSCNEVRCPVDCGLEEWEEWSTCNVKCGGGQMERSRFIRVHPASGGLSCAPTLETQSCSFESCSSECHLSEWTNWTTSCSRACGGGQNTRLKKLIKPATGDGTCADFYDSTRFQMQDCNTQPCNYHNGVPICKAKLDVILIMDGSGSLGAEGWAAVQNVSARFARAMQGNVSLAALLFSGPKDGWMTPYCLGQRKGYEPTPQECGMQWVSRLTSDTESVATGIESMQWPAMDTLTSMALKSAEQELSNGRQDAQSVVIVLTDGEPTSFLKTTEASADLMQKARVMMIPIGSGIEVDKVLQWVSMPHAANVVPVENFAALTDSNSTIEKVITDFCPALDFGPTLTTTPAGTFDLTLL